MASSTPIRIIITGNADDAKRALHDLDSSLGSAERRIQSFGSSLTNFGKISALVSLGTDALALAGNLAPALGILAALPAVASTAAAAIGTLFVGLHGLSDAFKTSSSSGGAAAVNTTSYQRAIEAAARGVTQAERDLSDAQEKAREAQDSLNQARIQAAADLAAYVDKLADASLNEESANIALQEAQLNLQQTQASGTATALQLEKANYDVADAAQRYKEAQEQATQTQKDAADAQTKGVDGADSVVKAQKDVDLANRNVADSQEKIVLANQQLADAQENLANALNKTSGAANKQAQALAALSPNARAFVEEVLSLKGAFDSLKNSVQDALFAGLNTQVKELAAVSFPTLRTGMTSVATGFNGIAVASFQAMDTPMFQGAMANAFAAARTMLDQFTPAVGPLLTGLANLSNVALPFLERFNGWLASWAARAGVFLTSAQGAERMRQVLDKATAVLQQVWAIGTDVWHVLENLFKAADNTNMLGVLQQITGELAKWSGTAEGQRTLQTLFTTLGQIAPSLASNLPAILHALGDIASAFNSLPGSVKSATGEIFAWSIALGPIVSMAGGAVGAIRGMTGAVGELALAMKGESESAFASFIVSAGGAAVAAVTTAATVVGGWIAMAAGAVVDAAIMAAAWIMAFWPIALVIAAVVGLVAIIIANWGTISRVTVELWDNVKRWTGEAWDWVSGKINGVLSWVGNLGSSIAKASAGMWDGIKDAFRAAIDWIIDGWNRLHFKMPSFDTHLPGIGVIGGFDLGLPQIPRLATGGIIKAQPGGTLALLAEAGRDEAVVPLPRSGAPGLGTTVEYSPTYQINAPIYGVDDLQAVLRDHDAKLLQLLEAQA